MESNEYEEYLKQREGRVKRYYLKKFEEFPNDGVFRKIKHDMDCDYEFIDNVVMPVSNYTNPRSKRNNINRISLYFVKVDNDTCVEYLTGEEFVRTIDPSDGSVHFYSDKTGLYFDFNSGFEPAVGMILDDVYTNSVVPFFNYYEELKKEDDRLRSNSAKLMLIRQKK